MASIILKHRADGVVPGISEAAPEEQPPVALVFWSFRVMVGLGFLMIGVALLGLFMRRKGRIFQNKLLPQNIGWYDRRRHPIFSSTRV